MRLKRLARAGLHGLGGYGAYHRLRNRHALTVAMFHRVLPESDPRFAESDPAYTVSLTRFVDYLDFFARHYSVIDYRRLVEHAPLPPRPLLITFDDGWSDTVEFAIPALRSRGWSGLLFVAGCAVGRERPFWQEALVGAVRAGRLPSGRLRTAAAEFLDGSELPAGPDDDLAEARRIVAQLEQEDWAAVEDFVFTLPEVRSAGGRAMAGRRALERAAAEGTAIGAHGFSHRPLTRSDPDEELRRCRAVLEPIAAAGASGALDAFSFPHGVFDAAAVAAARRDGHRFLFTSEAQLNPADPELLERATLGRIAVGGETASAPDGRIVPAERANWFFNRRRPPWRAAPQRARPAAGPLARPDRNYGKPPPCSD